MLPLAHHALRLTTSSFHVIVTRMVLGVYPTAGGVFARLSNMSVPIAVKALLGGGFSLPAIAEEEAVLYYYPLCDKSVRRL